MPRARAARAVMVDGRPYVRRPDGTLAAAVGTTDWARIDAKTDSELTAAAEADSDARPMSDEEWARAPVVHPTKRRIGLRLDADVIDWFQSQGKGYQTRMNAVLRRYMAAQRRSG